MKQDVNFLLLSLLLIALMGMAAIALFAQSEYQRLFDMNLDARANLEKKSALLDNKTSEVETMRQELETRQQSLVDMVKELNLSKERQESLGGFFTELKGAKESLEENLTAVEEAKGGLERRLQAANKDLEVCTVTVSFKDKQIANSSSKISKLVNQIASYSITFNKENSGLGDINTDLTKVKTDLASYESKINSIKNSINDSSAKTELTELKGDIADTRVLVEGDINEVADLKQSAETAWRSSLVT
jgi:chromosome segregation ATPase